MREQSKSDSTSTDHSIGIVSNGGKSLNKGTIEVNGADGLGLYAVNNGTVTVRNNNCNRRFYGWSYAGITSNIDLTAEQ